LEDSDWLDFVHDAAPVENKKVMENIDHAATLKNNDIQKGSCLYW
jgi:hypothetical protein